MEYFQLNKKFLQKFEKKVNYEKIEHDEDVQKEITRIENHESSQDLVLVDKLRKVYPNGKVAIE